MPISAKTTKILWANAAGRCAFPGCQMKLCTESVQDDAHYTTGEMAHIRGDRSGSNRYDESQSQGDRDDYPNVILLCPNHHAEIDKPENLGEFTIAVLLKMKAEHEANVKRRLGSIMFQSSKEVAEYVLLLMTENHEAFLNYGPQSETARKNPQSDAHVVWASERLATIVPNNRLIGGAIAANKHLFGEADQPALAKFELHARSYEKWVNEEISYEGVTRFPDEFASLISERALGRA